MKRVLSLVLALVMVLGMIPTFAADMTGGEHLLEHGFIAGKPGDTNEAKIDASAALTRQELAALIAELMGEKEIAATFAQPADYEDADMIGSWAVPYVAYAQYNAWMSGKSGNMFDPTGPVPGQQLAAVIMNALGYTVDTQAKYATALADAAELGIAISSNNLNRGDAFEAMWIAVSEVNVAGEEQTLGVKLGKLEAPVVVPTELAVVSATASNLAEINVTFNMELDAAKVTVANFRVGNADAAAVKLSEDKMTVVVTPGTISAVNPKDYALVVKMAVGLAADYTATVTAFDTTLPVVENVVLTGPTTFDIIFSEPMNPAVAGTVLVNNGIFGAAAAVPVGNKVSVTLGAALPDGTYEVKISGYADYAGFPIPTTTTSLVYAKDISALTASITSAKQNEVKVMFSKKIATALTVNHFYHTFSAWAPNTISTTDNQTYTLGFTTYTIPEGNFNLVVKATDGTTKVTDVWGVDLAANTTLVGSVTADKTAPTVVVKEVTSESMIKVEFSEAVTGGATAANYIVRKADGTALTGVTATLDTGNVYNINLGAVQAAGVYTIEVKNVTDTALTPNTIQPVILSFTVTDKTPPAVTAVSWVDTAAATPEYVYVTFSEAVATTGTNSALDKNNYRVNGSIPTDVTAFGLAGTKVRLSVADATTVTSVTWGQIADLAGNKMVALTGTADALSTPALTLEGAIDSTNITSITTKSLNTVEVVINKVIPTLTAAAFTVEEGAGGADVAAPAMISYTNDGTKTTVLLTLTASTAMINSSDKPANVNFIAGGLVSDTGVTNALFTVAAGAIVDGIAPSYASIAQVSDAVFTITLDENIKAQNVSLMATDLVIKKANGTQLVAGVGYTVTYATNVITVTLATPLTANETLSVASVASPQYIVDAADNKVNAFTGKTIAMDLTAPAIADIADLTILATSVAGAAGAVEANATVKIVADGAGSAAAAAGSGAVVAAADGSFAAITGLTGTTAYDLYVIDAFGNVSAVLDITTP